MKNWKRLFQWRLSTLLILSFAACVFVGWQANIYHKQKKAIEWLNQLDCNVSIEYRPGWFFSLVRSVNIEGNLETVEPLAWCPYIESINVSALMVHEVDDDGFKTGSRILYPQVNNLEPLSSLEQLDFVSVFTSTPLQLGDKPFSKSLRVLSIGSPYAIDPSPLKPSQNLRQVMFYRTMSLSGGVVLTESEQEANNLRQEQAAKKFQSWRDQYPHCNFVYMW